MVKRYFRALHGAMGVKRYILGSVVLFVIGVHEALRAWLPTYGIQLPRLPTWEIAIPGGHPNSPTRGHPKFPHLEHTKRRLNLGV
jgi:hypothetical protein